MNHHTVRVFFACFFAVTASISHAAPRSAAALAEKSREILSHPTTTLTSSALCAGSILWLATKGRTSGAIKRAHQFYSKDPVARIRQWRRNRTIARTTGLVSFLIASASLVAKKKQAASTAVPSPDEKSSVVTPSPATAAPDPAPSQEPSHPVAPPTKSVFALQDGTIPLPPPPLPKAGQVEPRVIQLLLNNAGVPAPRGYTPPLPPPHLRSQINRTNRPRTITVASAAPVSPPRKRKKVEPPPAPPWRSGPTTSMPRQTRTTLPGKRKHTPLLPPLVTDVRPVKSPRLNKPDDDPDDDIVMTPVQEDADGLEVVTLKEAPPAGPSGNPRVAWTCAQRRPLPLHTASPPAPAEKTPVHSASSPRVYHRLLGSTLPLVPAPSTTTSGAPPQGIIIGTHRSSPAATSHPPTLTALASSVTSPASTPAGSETGPVLVPILSLGQLATQPADPFSEPLSPGSTPRNDSQSPILYPDEDLASPYDSDDDGYEVPASIATYTQAIIDRLLPPPAEEQSTEERPLDAARIMRYWQEIVRTNGRYYMDDLRGIDEESNCAWHLYIVTTMHSMGHAVEAIRPLLSHQSMPQVTPLSQAIINDVLEQMTHREVLQAAAQTPGLPTTDQQFLYHLINEDSMAIDGGTITQTIGEFQHEHRGANSSLASPPRYAVPPSGTPPGEIRHVQ